MSRDIFERQVDLGTPLAADATRLVLPDIGAEDMLVQNFSAQYQQNVNRLYEVGSFKTYFIAGRTQGTMQIKRIIGGKGVGAGFIKQFANVCNIAGNHFTISLNAGCTDSSNLGSLSFEGVVITSIAYSVAAQDMIINEDFTLLFAKLSLG
jgi:hypothetical protein